MEVKKLSLKLFDIAFTECDSLICNDLVKSQNYISKDSINK